MKTYKQKTFLQFFLLLTFITSVINTGKTQKFYLPGGGLNTLYFSEKNDFKLAVLIPNMEQKTKFLLGYSPLKYLSLSAGIVNADWEKDFGKWTSKYKGQLYTFSLGGYYPFDRSKEDGKKRELLLSSMIGYTKGGLTTDSGFHLTDFDFQKLFFQMGVTYSISSLSCGFYIKYNHINYLKGEIARLQNYPDLFGSITKFKENRYFESIETRFQITLGKGFVKGVLITGIENGLSKGGGNFLDHGDSSVGVIIELNTLAKSIKSKKKRK